MKASRLEELVDGYIDRRLTRTELSELETQLKSSTEARRQFWERMQFESLVTEVACARHINNWMPYDERAHVAGGSTRARASKPRGAAGFSWPRWILGYAALAVIALGGLLYLTLSAYAKLKGQPGAELTSDGVAVLVSGWNVKWPESQPPLANGSILPRGRIRLAAGVLGIESYNGVRLTIEGPADIDLTSVDEAICYQGRIRVLVPQPSQSFRVKTPDLDVLDLGTEFGLDASPSAKTEVHVFEGKVEYSSRSQGVTAGTKSHLVAGEAVRLENATFQRFAARPKDFVSRKQLDNLILAQTTARLKEWDQFGQKLRQDPSLLLFYQFNRAATNQSLVRNLATRQERASDGVIVGCDWTESRWPQQTALELKQPGDRVRVAVPGEYDSLTYVAWLRIDRLDRMFSAIFLTDGYEPGAPHWQITQGRIRLGIGDGLKRARRQTIAPGVETAQKGVDYDTGVVFTEADRGHWRQLAVVIDGSRGEVVHYLDGRMVSKAPMVVQQRLRIGAAELGNWGLPNSTDPQPIRNFNGRIGEFMIFADVVSEAEIRELYERGLPQPPAESAVVASSN